MTFFNYPSVSNYRPTQINVFCRRTGSGVTVKAVPAYEMLDQTPINRVFAFPTLFVWAMDFHDFEFGFPDTQTNEMPVIVPLHYLVNHATRLLLVFDWPVQVVGS